MKLCKLLFLSILVSSFTSNRIIHKKGFLFFVNNRIDAFFIESKDSIISDIIFSNPSYRIFDQICTRSPSLDYFRNTEIGRKVKFDYIVAFGDTLKNYEVNFIYCDLVLKKITKTRKIKEKIVGRIGDRFFRTINLTFINQIENLLPVYENELNILIEEIKKN